MDAKCAGARTQDTVTANSEATQSASADELAKRSDLHAMNGVLRPSAASAFKNVMSRADMLTRSHKNNSQFTISSQTVDRGVPGATPDINMQIPTTVRTLAANATAICAFALEHRSIQPPFQKESKMPNYQLYLYYIQYVNASCYAQSARVYAYSCSSNVGCSTR